MSDSSEPKHDGGDSKQKPENRQCVLCPMVRNTRQKMREHVLNHYKPQLLLSLPRRQPFRCPECNSKNRDKITLLRHYAFHITHKHIYKFSNDRELLGILVSEAGSPVLVTLDSLDGEMTTQETHLDSRVSSLPINSSPFITSNFTETQYYWPHEFYDDKRSVHVSNVRFYCRPRKGFEITYQSYAP